MLRDPVPSVAPPVVPPSGEKIRAAAPSPPPPLPDLIPLLADGEARVRRRAALSVGRVGLAEGVEPLLTVLRDADPEVRQMAAFALGLLGDKRARDPLVLALADPSPLVQGSAAEALGLIGDSTAAGPVGRMMAEVVRSAVLAQPPGDEDDRRRDTPAAAFRLGAYALVRLKSFDELAAAVLDPSGQPRVRWWPVAFALQRLEDPRALNALLALTGDAHPYTRMFAVKGLAALKDRTALPLLVPLASSGDRLVATEAVRALGRIGDPGGAPALRAIIENRNADVRLRSEAAAAIGGIRTTGVSDVLVDLLLDPHSSLRAAALRSLAALDPEAFITVLSSLDPDADWNVRAALASVLGTLTPDLGLPRLQSLLNDSDQRVVPSVLASLVKLRDPRAAAIMAQRLKADDPAIRAAAANGIGELKPSDGAPALASAYAFGLSDATYTARTAALVALAQYGPAEAQPILGQALADKDWAVRIRAAALLKQLDPSGDAARQIRPAPTHMAPESYQATRLVDPPVTTEVYIDTDRGTVQIELAVLDAPLTVENFVTLARNRFFDGLSVHRVAINYVMQTGDPRGDSEGGPGYTIRDELNELPYLRGTVGMALDWADTGGSQFFITYAPQPHLDAKYTVFGRVVAGMDVVDAIEQGEVIRRVRVWDGQPESR